MMPQQVLSLLNVILAVAIVAVIIRVYLLYRRQYILWFALSFAILPFMFIYSLVWPLPGTTDMGIVVFPICVIVVEVGFILAQKNLLTSIRGGASEEHQMLLRDDVALLRSYRRVANVFIRKITPLIGTASIEELLESRIDEYPVLAGSYIDVDERLNVTALEEVIDKLDMDDLGIAFYEVIAGLIELYSAFVPWMQATDEWRNAVARAVQENDDLFEWALPIVLFRLVLEPVLRRCRSDDINEIAIMLNRSKSGIEIRPNGQIDIRTLYRRQAEADDAVQFIIERFLHALDRMYLILKQDMGPDKVNAMITEHFRAMPTNIKERLYGEGLVEQLPEGILEEEKVTLLSRERLIEELLSRRKKLERAYRELAEAELGKMKTTFLDVIAHELRTPLTSIKTYVDLMKKEKLGDLSQVQKEKLDIMAQNVERLTTLINDMLEIPSIDVRELELRKETFPAQEMILSIVRDCREIAEEKQQQLSIEVPETLTLHGDRNLLGKAVKNILVNAVRYTPEGGRITISGRSESEQTHLTIADTGPGIPEDEIERVFEPFYTGRESGGMGLGLSIVKNIVEAHSGDVWAESAPGKGTTFHIRLAGGTGSR
ncbi:MAG: sensor histidine kinase [Thermoplasmatota archaeon]